MTLAQFKIVEEIPAPYGDQEIERTPRPPLRFGWDDDTLIIGPAGASVSPMDFSAR